MVGWWGGGVGEGVGWGRVCDPALPPAPSPMQCTRRLVALEHPHPSNCHAFHTSASAPAYWLQPDAPTHRSRPTHPTPHRCSCPSHASTYHTHSGPAASTAAPPNPPRPSRTETASCWGPWQLPMAYPTDVGYHNRTRPSHNHTRAHPSNQRLPPANRRGVACRCAAAA